MELAPRLDVRELAKTIDDVGIPNKLRTYQEINRTLYDGEYKLDYRIETHNKLGNYTNGDNSGNYRHQNVDLYQRIDGRWFRIDLPRNGHTIINKAD
jgi:hypothetical protein